MVRETCRFSAALQPGDRELHGPQRLRAGDAGRGGEEQRRVAGRLVEPPFAPAARNGATSSASVKSPSVVSLWPSSGNTKPPETAVKDSAIRASASSEASRRRWLSPSARSPSIATRASTV